MITFKPAHTVEDIKNIRDLFTEYSGSLDFKLDFQNYDEELKNLPGKYSPPGGRLYIALSDNKPAGCIALRKIDNDYCEMKRLFVKPEFRGLNIGKALTEIIINEAGKAGYKFMRLDTISTMSSARKIYESFGFKEIPAYIYNPVEGAIYMELKIKPSGGRSFINETAGKIELNAWKHHLNFLAGQVKYLAGKGEQGYDEMMPGLKKMGASQLDFYTGSLLTEEIILNTADELSLQNAAGIDSFYKWLIENGRDFRNINMTDGSTWTLRINRENEKYIHIHPSRYSPHTIRVRANTLRSAFVGAVSLMINECGRLDIEIINSARSKYLGEPPVKSVNINSGIGSIINLLIRQ